MSRLPSSDNPSDNLPDIPVDNPRNKWSIPFDVLERYLVVTSIVYLTVPYLIFGAGWLNWPWATLYVGLLAAALVETARSTFRRRLEAPPAQEDAPRFTLLHAGLILLASFVWIVPVGVAGYGPQKTDWIKHEVIFKALIDEPWPPFFTFYDHVVGLVFYVAYYLPAAVVGKLAGWEAAHHALFVWTFIGLVLSMLWFCLLIRRVSIPLIILFVVFSGQDIIAAIIAHWADWTHVRIGILPTLEAWSHFLQYSSFTTLLLWVPHQGIAGWLAAALILSSMVYTRRRNLVLLALGLSVLFSPFVTIGLGLYLVVDFFIDGDPVGKRFRSYYSIANGCGILLLFVAGVYYASKVFEISPFVNIELSKGFYFDIYQGSTLDALGILIVFWVVEFGLYILLLYWGLRYDDKRWRAVFWTTVVYLFFIPLYKYGFYNDFVMRTSIPALFITGIFLGRVLYNRRVPLAVRGALLVLLLIGVATSLGEIRPHLGIIRKTGRWIAIPAYDEVANYTDFYRTTLGLGINYIGTRDSPFFNYLAKTRSGPFQTFPAEMPLISYDDLILLADFPPTQPGPLRPGETFRVDIPLHGNSQVVKLDYDVVLRLVDAEGKEWAKAQGWVQNRPTSGWVNHVEWPDTRDLTIPPDAPPGTYRLELSIVESETQKALPAHVIASGERLPDNVPVGEVVVGVDESASAAR